MPRADRGGVKKGVAKPPARPRFFENGAAFNRWLAKHHDSAGEVWVGYYKRTTGLPTMTWPESVDEALCWGWIDGIRRSLDAVSYMIRFTPRRRDSTWSQINLRRVEALTTEGRMHAPGLAAFEARDPRKTLPYSFETLPSGLPAVYRRRLRANARAWAFFQRQPPWYRKSCAWWIISAKREETRERRLRSLIRDSERGRTIPPLTRARPGA